MLHTDEEIAAQEQRVKNSREEFEFAKGGYEEAKDILEAELMELGNLTQDREDYNVDDVL
jgi:hypothetical protein